MRSTCGTMRAFMPESGPLTTEMQTISVRRASRRDAKALAGLAEKTFRDAFAAMNTAGNMDAFCRSAYGEAIQAEEIARADMLTLLCELHGRLVGFAQLRWGAAPGCVVAGAPAEIQRLYVDRDSHGSGVARDLMNACIDAMLARRSDVAWLGVWEHNPRAIAFYRKCGFVAVGEQIFQLGSDPQRDVVMSRKVRQ